MKNNDEISAAIAELGETWAALSERERERVRCASDDIARIVEIMSCESWWRDNYKELSFTPSYRQQQSLSLLAEELGIELRTRPRDQRRYQLWIDSLRSMTRG